MQDVVIGMIRTIRDQLLDELSEGADKELEIDRVGDFLFSRIKPIFPAFVQAMASEIPREPEFRQRLSGRLMRIMKRSSQSYPGTRKTGRFRRSGSLISGAFHLWDVDRAWDDDPRTWQGQCGD